MLREQYGHFVPPRSPRDGHKLKGRARSEGIDWLERVLTEGLVPGPEAAGGARTESELARAPAPHGPYQ